MERGQGNENSRYIDVDHRVHQHESKGDREREENGEGHKREEDFKEKDLGAFFG